MSNNISITLTGDSKGAEQAIGQVQRENEKLARQLEKLRDKSKKANDEGERGMNRTSTATLKATQSVAGMVTTYVSLGAAVTAAIGEVEKLNRLQENARQATLGPAQAVREAKLAIEDDKFLSSKNLEQVAMQIAEQTHAKVETVSNVIGVASSAKGDLPNEQLLDATKQALRIDPSKPDQAAVLASRMLDLAKFSGTNDMRVNAGFMQNLGQASHVKSFELIGQNLVPSINSMTNFGDTQEGAGELVSAMTQMLAEDEGRISATASLQLAKQLKDFFPQRAGKGKFKGQLLGKDNEGEFAIPDAQFESLRQAGSTQERLDVMRQSPELRRGFLGQASFETKADASVRALVSGGEVAMRTLEQAQKVIRGTQSVSDKAFQSKLFESKITDYESGQFQAQLTTEQGVSSALELSALTNTPGTRAASARNAFKLALDNTNLPGWDVLEGTAKKIGLWATETNQSISRSLGRDVGEPEDPVLERLRAYRDYFELAGRPADAERFAKIEKEIERQRNSFQSGQDPQMSEQNAILKQINVGIAGLLKATQQQQNAPRQTERPASRLSRNNR